MKRINLLKAMRVFIAVLFLIFSLQTWTKADDIRDFEIDGVSIGDSALDFFSEEHLNKYKAFNYKDKKFYESWSYDFSKTYDYIQLSLIDKDKNYIIYDVAGGIFYNKNEIQKCLKKMDEVINDIEKYFKDLNKTNKITRSHRGDPTGKSKITEVAFFFKDSSSISIQCHQYSDAIDFKDQLVIELASKDFLDWINNVAFKSTSTE